MHLYIVHMSTKSRKSLSLVPWFPGSKKTKLYPLERSVRTFNVTENLQMLQKQFPVQLLKKSLKLNMLLTALIRA